MHMLRIGGYAVIVGAVLALASPGRLSANDGTPAKIYELMQDQQDVVITLAIVEGGEPGFNEDYTVTRSGPTGERTVVDDEQFDDADVVDSERRCRGGWNAEEQCAEVPDECEDCDDDGVLECWVAEDGWCETVNYVEVVDRCVPPGETDYELTAEDWGWFDDEESIDVEDTGASCLDDDSGCSVSRVGAEARFGAVALFMLGIGLLAGRLGRRGKR
jgi:hypothetical protein